MSDSVARVRAALLVAGHADTVSEFPEGTRTSQDAASAVGCTVAQIAKSIVLRTGDQAVLVIASGANRVDLAKISALIGTPVKSADGRWVRDVTEDIARAVIETARAEDRSLSRSAAEFVERVTGKTVPWTLAFLVSVAISMALLELASRSIPMGTAYAVWGGIGAVGTVVVGILWFHEPSSMVRVLLILAIVAAIAALRMTG